MNLDIAWLCSIFKYNSKEQQGEKGRENDYLGVRLSALKDIKLENKINSIAHNE